jgi:hypothetical protein
MMPGFDGLQVCAKLRASNLKVRPYVIIHSARGEKADIVAGLDSGADDYLPKPVNSGELLARLRAAERAIAYQREINRRIEEMELLVQRYNLLGEMVGNQTNPAGSFSAQGFTTGHDRSGQPHLTARLTDVEIQGIVLRKLEELGLGEPRAELVTREGPYRPAPFTAWAGIVFPTEHIWIDLLLEADRPEMEELCAKSLHRSGRGLELQGVLAETHTILSAAVKTAIQSKGYKVLSPLLSRVRFTQTLENPLPEIPKRQSHTFTFGDCSLGLTVVVSQCRFRRKEVGQLSPLDILAEPVFLSDMPDVPLLNHGAVLNERYIERLAIMALDDQTGLLVPVFEPSELARYFSR